jgi:hypothetical protein
MPALRLVQRHSLHSELSPQELREQLAAAIEQTDGEFPLVSKLSGGGIVIRVLNAPSTSRPFFGQITGPNFAISQSTRGREVTPFQPIVHGTIERDEADVTRVELILRPHPDAPTFERAGKVAAVLLALVSIPAALSGQPLALVAIFFAALFWVFPRARARIAFTHDCARALAALEQATPLIQERARDEERATT